MGICYPNSGHPGDPARDPGCARTARIHRQPPHCVFAESTQSDRILRRSALIGSGRPAGVIRGVAGGVSMNSPTTGRGRHSAFTLIELLVVIAIIAILI